MKYSLVAACVLLAPAAMAYSPITVSTEQPFDEIIIPMDEVGQSRSYLGTLVSFPHLYEFNLEENTVLQMRTRQRATKEAHPVNLIMLAIDPATERISEVVRSNAPIEDRTRDFDSSLGISVIESDWLEIELEPGIYRLEVSTPRNEIPYELDFGQGTVENSYFGTFGTIWQIQRHFEYWWTRYFLSTFILYQVGIALMLGGFWYTWKRRKDISHAT